MCHMPHPSHFAPSHHWNTTLQMGSNHEAHIMQFLLVSCYFIPLQFKQTYYLHTKDFHDISSLITFCKLLGSLQEIAYITVCNSVPIN
jgi:hypothetical protein